MFCVRATLAEGKVHTRCLSGARVLDVSVQIPAILKDDESVAAVVIHAGANDIKLRQTETLKRDFRSLIETVRSTSPAATIIVSGPLPTYRRGHEKFSRLFALNEWLFSCCKEQNILSDLLVNVDKALIVGDFNIHVDNTNDALGLAFTDLINSFCVKQNVTGPTNRFNHTLDLIISHGIELTDIDIVPQSDDVTDHFLVSCMLHITDMNYMAPRYRPGRIIIPATKDRFTNNLPDLSQLLCVPINTDELDTITSNMGTIFSNTLESVAPIKLKKG